MTKSVKQKKNLLEFKLGSRTPNAKRMKSRDRKSLNLRVNNSKLV